ncbi:MAG: hypothetical protein Q8936_07275 [Bacillota bacterium]|nr:hypothetical protein [Bacillota bacterium]
MPYKRLIERLDEERIEADERVQRVRELYRKGEIDSDMYDLYMEILEESLVK